jgi:hypothetical protein
MATTDLSGQIGTTLGVNSQYIVYGAIILLVVVMIKIAKKIG